MDNIQINSFVYFQESNFYIGTTQKALNSSIFPEAHPILPLLLNTPRYNEQANLITKSISIGKITCSISNTMYDGLEFFERLSVSLDQEIITLTIFDKSDPILLADYVVQSYSLDKDVLTLNLEDRSDQTTALIPRNKIDPNANVPEKYKNMPYPMVYGTVDKAKCVITDLGDTDTVGGEVIARSIKLSPDFRDIITTNNLSETNNRDKYPFNFINNNTGHLHGNHNTQGFLYVYDGNYFRVPNNVDPSFDFSSFPGIENGQLQVYKSEGFENVFNLNILNEVKREQAIGSNIVSNGFLFVDIIRKPTSIQVSQLQNTDISTSTPSLDIVCSSSLIDSIHPDDPFQGGPIIDDVVNWDKFLKQNYAQPMGIGLLPHTHSTSNYGIDDATVFGGIIFDIQYDSISADVAKVEKNGDSFELHRALMIADIRSGGRGENELSVTTKHLHFNSMNEQNNEDPERKDLYTDLAHYRNNYSNGNDLLEDDNGNIIGACNMNEFNLPPNFSFQFYTLNGIGYGNFEDIEDRFVILKELDFVSQLVKKIDYSNSNFYASVTGRYDSTGNLIVNAYNILNDIINFENSLNGSPTFTIDSNHINLTDLSDFNFDFSWGEEITIKDFLEEFTRSTPLIGKFFNQNRYKLLHIKSEWTGEEVNKVITADDVIKISSRRTDINKSYNKCTVKYSYDEARGVYLNELTEDVNNILSINNYSNVRQTDNVLTIESRFIDKESAARKLALYHIGNNCNRKTIITVSLPLYMLKNYELLDVVKFDKMVEGRIFNEDYTIPVQRNGQTIYPYFVITKLSFTNVLTLELTQLHKFSTTGSIGVCNDPRYIEYLDPFGTGELVDINSGQYVEDNSLCLTKIPVVDESDPTGYCLILSDDQQPPGLSTQSDCLEQGGEWRPYNTFTEGCTVPYITDGGGGASLNYSLNYNPEADYDTGDSCVFQNLEMAEIQVMNTFEGMQYLWEYGIINIRPYDFIRIQVNWRIRNTWWTLDTIPEVKYSIVESQNFQNVFFEGDFQPLPPRDELEFSAAGFLQNPFVTEFPSLLECNLPEMYNNGDPAAFSVLIQVRNLAEFTAYGQSGTFQTGIFESGNQTVKQAATFNINLVEQGEEAIPNILNARIFYDLDDRPAQYYNRPFNHFRHIPLNNWIPNKFKFIGRSNSSEAPNLLTHFSTEDFPPGTETLDIAWGNSYYEGAIVKLLLLYASPPWMPDGSDNFKSTENIRYTEDFSSNFPQFIAIDLTMGMKNPKVNFISDAPFGNDGNIEFVFSEKNIDFYHVQSVEYRTYDYVTDEDGNIIMMFSDFLGSTATEILTNMFIDFLNTHKKLPSRLCTDGFEGKEGEHTEGASFINSEHNVFKTLDRIPEMWFGSINLVEAKIGFSYYDVFAQDNFTAQPNAIPPHLFQDNRIISGVQSDFGWAARVLGLADYYHQYLPEGELSEFVGDVNLDFVVNVSDIVQVVQYVLGQGNLPFPFLADVTGDGLINVNDIITMISTIFSQPEGVEPISGCTDINATNYNPQATVDDGSCTYPPGQSPLEEMISLGGDITNDNEVNVADIVFLANVILNLNIDNNDPKTYPSGKLPDINQDGSVNVSDIVAIISFILNGTVYGSDNVVNNNLKKLRKHLRKITGIDSRSRKKGSAMTQGNIMMGVKGGY